MVVAPSFLGLGCLNYCCGRWRHVVVEAIYCCRGPMFPHILRCQCRVRSSLEGCRGRGLPSHCPARRTRTSARDVSSFLQLLLRGRATHRVAVTAAALVKQFFEMLLGTRVVPCEIVTVIVVVCSRVARNARAKKTAQGEVIVRRRYGRRSSWGLGHRRANRRPWSKGRKEWEGGTEGGR